MIPGPAIVEWGRGIRWPTGDQIEQDLLLSRLIVEIANDSYLGEELVFRGGTCLHKLRLASPYRYSEDLDYVRRSGGGIAEITRSLTSIGSRLGLEVRTKIGQHPKVFFRAPFESGEVVMKVKVEMNTFERSPARPYERVHYSVRSSWFRGDADVATFALPELVATKIRALFQRSKGRDLFDLWLALTLLEVDPEDLLTCFDPYRPDGMTAVRAEQNLRLKLAEANFRADLIPLVNAWPADYEIDAAAELVIASLLSKL
jgi:predicted nucleotidyltransferase component of viral defense system